MKSLSIAELDAFLNVAKKHSERDYLMFLVTFLHGLRISETLSLTAENIVDGHLVVQRSKGSRKTVQRLLADESDIVLLAKQRNGLRLFPLTRMTCWRKMQRYGRAAGLPAFLCHPHALRHTTAMLMLDGSAKVNAVQNYLGHVNGANTLRYLELSDEEGSKAFAAAVGKK
jgi:integrase